jgi:ketosteroid isomerase-like protein
MGLRSKSKGEVPHRKAERFLEDQPVTGCIITLMSDNLRDSKQIIESFWAAMQTNDFKAAGELLHDDYLLEWPQSGERIRGHVNFVAINEKYPAHGRWNFIVQQVIAEGDKVVSDVKVTDGVVHGRVITFSTVCDGKILHQTEFWPDPFEAAAWRAQWVEKM